MLKPASFGGHDIACKRGWVFQNRYLMPVLAAEWQAQLTGNSLDEVRSCENEIISRLHNSRGTIRTHWETKSLAVIFNVLSMSAWHLTDNNVYNGIIFLIQHNNLVMRGGKLFIVRHTARLSSYSTYIHIYSGPVINGNFWPVARFSRNTHTDWTRPGQGYGTRPVKLDKVKVGPENKRWSPTPLGGQTVRDQGTQLTSKSRVLKSDKDINTNKFPSSEELEVQYRHSKFSSTE